MLSSATRSRRRLAMAATLGADVPPGSMATTLGADVPLGCWAKATLRDRSVHFGVVHTVDPEAGTVVLLVPTDGGDANGDANGDAAAPSTAVRPLVVFGHALSSLEPLGAPAAGAPALELRRAVAEAAAPDAAALALRHDALCALLRRRHLPFESRGGAAARTCLLYTYPSPRDRG